MAGAPRGPAAGAESLSGWTDLGEDIRGACRWDGTDLQIYGTVRYGIGARGTKIATVQCYVRGGFRYESRYGTRFFVPFKNRQKTDSVPNLYHRYLGFKKLE